jgi:hypothetical protein
MEKRKITVVEEYVWMVVNETKDKKKKKKKKKKKG